MAEDRCVMCGSVIPEGRQVCSLCRAAHFPAVGLRLLPPDGWTPDLLEAARRQVGCPSIAGLCHLPYRSDALRWILSTPPDNFPLAAWQETVRHFTGTRRRFRSAAAAKSFLASHIPR